MEKEWVAWTKISPYDHAMKEEWPKLIPLSRVLVPLDTCAICDQSA